MQNPQDSGGDNNPVVPTDQTTDTPPATETPGGGGAWTPPAPQGDAGQAPMGEQAPAAPTEAPAPEGQTGQ